MANSPRKKQGVLHQRKKQGGVLPHRRKRGGVLPHWKNGSGTRSENFLKESNSIKALVQEEKVAKISPELKSLVDKGKRFHADQFKDLCNKVSQRVTKECQKWTALDPDLDPLEVQTRLICESILDSYPNQDFHSLLLRWGRSKKTPDFVKECVHAVNAMSKQLGMTITEFLEKFRTWKIKPPNARRKREGVKMYFSIRDQKYEEVVHRIDISITLTIETLKVGYYLYLCIFSDALFQNDYRKNMKNHNERVFQFLLTSLAGQQTRRDFTKTLFHLALVFTELSTVDTTYDLLKQVCEEGKEHLLVSAIAEQANIGQDNVPQRVADAFLKLDNSCTDRPWKLDTCRGLIRTNERTFTALRCAAFKLYMNTFDKSLKDKVKDIRFPDSTIQENPKKRKAKGSP